MSAQSPTLVVDSATNRVFVIGVDAAGAKGAPLASGDSVSLTIDNPAIATIALDPSPLPDPNGVPSVASGVLSPVAPIQTATPFNAVAVATIGGVAQAPVSLAIQWQAGTATSVIEEVN
jgi:hypothetical protein